MKSYFVYILKCNDNSYYTGVTNDIKRRITEHQSGKNIKAYTYSRRPLKLEYYHEFSDINLAIAFEKKIKGWSKIKKKTLINDEVNKLPNLSKKKFS